MSRKRFLLLQMSHLRIVGFLGLVSEETDDEARRNISNTRDARAALERGIRGSHREQCGNWFRF